jgi:acyl carrier protein
MNAKIRSEMRNYVTQRLRMKGDGAALGDEDPLFSSGRLDSLDAVEIIMCIETDYGINFSEFNFDLTLLDSIAAIDELVERRPSAA